MLRSLFEWADAQPSSIAIRESIYGWPYLLTSHAVFMALFAGLIVMMDLRLMGFAFKRMPLSQVQRQLFPWQMGTFGLSVATGLILLWAKPMVYYGRWFFWIKMTLMFLAGVNSIAFHLGTYKTVATWDTSSRPPMGARLAGAFGLALWAGVVVFGRFTAYNWWD
jgi:hypothetical protein